MILNDDEGLAFLDTSISYIVKMDTWFGIIMGYLRCNSTIKKNC